jgi:hypothetical protein
VTSQQLPKREVRANEANIDPGAQVKQILKQRGALVAFEAHDIFEDESHLRRVGISSCEYLDRSVANILKRGLPKFC